MSDETDTKTKDGNNFAVPLIVIVLVALVAIGAYVYMNRNAVEPAPAEVVASDEGELLPAIEDSIEEETMSEPPSPAEEMAAEAEVVEPLDIEQAMAPRSLGDPNAPVKMKEYMSLTCSHCASFHNNVLPELQKYIESGELYIEFNEFPLNAPALRASMIARCLPESRYNGFIKLLFSTQDVWATTPDYMTALRQNAKLAGMSDAQFDACIANNELQQEIGKRIQLATAQYEIDSTPTFIVNDGAEIIKGAQAPYEFERVFRAVTDGQVAPLPAEEEAPAAEEPVAEEDVPAEEAPAEEAPAEEPAAE